MKMIKLSLQNLFFKPLNLMLSLVLFSLGIGLISLLFNLNKQITSKFENNLAGIDLIIGAKGSPLQLVLNGLYHIDAPTGNIPLKDVLPFMNPKHPLIKKAVPLSLGDSYNGFRVVGTNLDFPALYKAELSNGNWWQMPMQTVIGSTVSTITKLKIGDTFISSHGLTTDDFNKHDHAPFVVVGILKSTNTVCDQLILTPPESIWQVHEHALKKDTTDQDHDHEEDQLTDTAIEHDITTLLVQFKAKNIMTLNMQRSINQNTQLQAANPAIEINRLFSMMGIGFDALKLLAWVIAFVSGLSIFISLFNSLKERKQELGLMRILGATPVKLFTLILMEGIIIACMGYIIGIFLSHFALQLSAENIFKAYKYKIAPWSFIPEEAWLWIGAISIGIIAAIIPAVQAYRTDIAKSIK